MSDSDCFRICAFYKDATLHSIYSLLHFGAVKDLPVLITFATICFAG